MLDVPVDLNQRTPPGFPYLAFKANNHALNNSKRLKAAGLAFREIGSPSHLASQQNGC
tara:strand:- start:24700 stop:24873 length:174 start_codon:yes stop_codon:yes gene_type:complete